MTPIVDQQGNTIAYLHLNIILNQQQDAVLGLVLGNCVFGEAEAPIGKFFKDTFRTMNGKIVAELGEGTSPARPLNESAILKQAWSKLTAVKDHLCMWIEERDSWSDQDFTSFLQSRQKVLLAM